MALSESIKVWHRCEAKQKDGSLIKLRYQDLTLNRKEEAIELNITYMLKDEAFHVATGIYRNKEAVEEYRNLINMPGNKQVMVCCIDDETEYGGRIVGLSTVGLMKNTESINDLTNKFPVKSCTTEMQNLFNMISVLENLTDLKNKFEQFYKGYGVIVHPDYRGLGIANEFFRLRYVMCNEYNIPMSAAWMTAKGSQRAAENNKWKTDTIITPEELGRRTGLTFPENTVNFMYMYVTKD